ncbi:hypothetical protein DL96DRAFT_587652 [Flagelloscypha sp. PMI_526]|nr:hypothetical protein DL96DRAFT_587652 [Flagelloscypha sp. PMI_526]
MPDAINSIIIPLHAKPPDTLLPLRIHHGYLAQVQTRYSLAIDFAIIFQERQLALHSLAAPVLSALLSDTTGVTNLPPSAFRSIIRTPIHAIALPSGLRLVDQFAVASRWEKQVRPTTIRRRRACRFWILVFYHDRKTGRLSCYFIFVSRGPNLNIWPLPETSNLPPLALHLIYPHQIYATQKFTPQLASSSSSDSSSADQYISRTRTLKSSTAQLTSLPGWISINHVPLPSSKGDRRWKRDIKRLLTSTPLVSRPWNDTGFIHFIDQRRH